MASLFSRALPSTTSLLRLLWLTPTPPWLARDRFRTMINVLGDALAAGIMAHICRKDFAQDTGTEVRAASPQEASKRWSQAGIQVSWWT